VVVLNKKAADDEVRNVLEKSTKFKRINLKTGNNHLQKVERTLRVTCKKLSELSKSLETLQTNTKIPVMVCIPEIRHEKIQYQPILHFDRVYEHTHVCWLVEKLSDIGRHANDISSSKQFAESVNSRKIYDDQMCSFFVDDLHLNIPTDFCVDLILENVFKEQKEFYDLEKEYLCNLLKTVCMSIIKFDEKYYKQVEGVLLGSPIALLLVDAFMNWVLNEMQCKCDVKPTVLLKHAESLFCVFGCEEDTDNYFCKLEQICSDKLKRKTSVFQDKAVQGQLVYLGVLVKKEGHQLKSTIYDHQQKPGFENRRDGQNFMKGMFQCMTVTSKTRCLEAFYSEMTGINAAAMLRNAAQTDKSSTPHERQFISISKLETFASDLGESLKELLPNLPSDLEEHQLFYKHLYCWEEEAPWEERCYVVYKLSCKYEGCENCYIGLTQRKLQDRVKEHQRKTINSKAQDHCHENDFSKEWINFDKPEIVVSADTLLDLKIKETLYIQHTNPQFNIKKSSTKMFLFSGF